MFKDSWARGEIRQLWEEIGTVSRRQGRLSERVAAQERRLDSTELVEKSCPACGRATLMRQNGPQLKMRSDGWYEQPPATFYCYSCGKKWTESTKAVLEEVKEGKE